MALYSTSPEFIENYIYWKWLLGAKFNSILLKVALYSIKLGPSGRGSDNRTQFFDLDIHFLAGTANKNYALKKSDFQGAAW